jgi:hypothetical protein
MSEVHPGTVPISATASSEGGPEMSTPEDVDPRLVVIGSLNSFHGGVAVEVSREFPSQKWYLPHPTLTYKASVSHADHGLCEEYDCTSFVFDHPDVVADAVSVKQVFLCASSHCGSFATPMLMACKCGCETDRLN